MRLRANLTSLAAETFEGEVVVVNFDNGRYHSLRGGAPEVWALLQQGVARTALAEWAASRGCDPAEMLRFLDALHSEELVVEEAAGPAADLPPGRGPLAAPTLETFRDMEELLWLDPVHDVDAQGWPVPPEPRS